jgi:hypothetical protein
MTKVRELLVEISCYFLDRAADERARESRGDREDKPPSEIYEHMAKIVANWVDDPEAHSCACVDPDYTGYGQCKICGGKTSSRDRAHARY